MSQPSFLLRNHSRNTRQSTQAVKYLIVLLTVAFLSHFLNCAASSGAVIHIEPPIVSIGEDIARDSHGIKSHFDEDLFAGLIEKDPPYGGDFTNDRPIGSEETDLSDLMLRDDREHNSAYRDLFNTFSAEANLNADTPIYYFSVTNHGRLFCRTVDGRAILFKENKLHYKDVQHRLNSATSTLDPVLLIDERVFQQYYKIDMDLNGAGHAWLARDGSQFYRIKQITTALKQRFLAEYYDRIYVDVEQRESEDIVSAMQARPFDKRSVSVLPLTTDSLTLDRLKTLIPAPRRLASTYSSKTSLEDAIRNAPGDTIVVLGHNEDGIFKTINSKNEVVFSIPLTELIQLARDCCKKLVYPVSCESASFVGNHGGIIQAFRATDAVDALALALEADTVLNFFRTFSKKANVDVVVSANETAFGYHVTVEYLTLKQINGVAGYLKPLGEATLYVPRPSTIEVKFLVGFIFSLILTVLFFGLVFWSYGGNILAALVIWIVKRVRPKTS